jgi:acyl carrier protein
MQAPEHELKQVLADVFGTPVEAITDNASIDTIEEWDSLKHLNLILALEDKFNITLTEQQTVEIISYELIKLVLAEHSVHFEN